MAKQASRRTHKQVEYLKARIIELDEKGYSQGTIANKLGMSQQMVNHYLRQIEAEVSQRVVPNRVVARQKQIAKVRLLMSSTWDAIHRLEQELQEHPENRSRIDSTIEMKHRFLLQCIAEENKLCGLYEKHDPTTQTTATDDLSQLSPEEIAEYKSWTTHQNIRIPSDGQSTEELQ